MMAYIQPTDRPVLYAAIGQIAGVGIAAHGETRVGDATGIASVLTAYSDEDENTFMSQLPAQSFPVLPDSGWLEQGDIYSYEGECVMVRQSHNRTIYAPDETPALFVVYREDAGDALEWVAGEEVVVGTRRLYEDVEYECLQAHVTQNDWTPPTVPALWQAVQPPSDEWQAWTAYTIGDVVLYEGIEYECRQSHTSQPGWEPPNVPALWLAL